MISVSNLSYYIGGRALYENASMFIKPKDKIGLIGLNGRGKSTLLKLINGDITPDAGSISKSNDCTIGFLNQDLLSYQSEDAIVTVAMEAFKDAVDTQRQIEHILHKLETEYSDALVEKLTKLQEKFEHLDGYSMQAKAEEVLEGIGFSTKDLHRPLKEFSGGWRMRVMLAKLLLEKPSMLMLDEPTNHLDLPSIEWVENYLRNYEGAVMVVSHDRTFLDNVAEISRILKFPDIEKKLNNPGRPEVVADDYPTETHHGWKYIAFGPDGKLYIPVGAPCNICDSDEEIFASITRMNADGTGREIYAHGVRNTVGFTWHPESKELWFTDNGRDMMGDNIPDCELNRAPEKGLHFGYPYCHAGSVKDPEFGGKRPCSEFVPPVQKLGPHVAPLGLKFYTGKMFPDAYRNQVFIARHGSWNRSKKSGYDLTMVKIENNKSQGVQTFASGWLDDASQKAWGRPVDVLMLDDGSMLVSDDTGNVIYRISYAAN